MRLLRTPRFLATGRGSEEIERQARAAGIEFFHKPMDLEGFRASVADHTEATCAQIRRDLDAATRTDQVDGEAALGPRDLVQPILQSIEFVCAALRSNAT